MWREYCKSSNGVVIKSNIDNLINSIHKHNFGPMMFRPVIYGQNESTNIDLRFPTELINFKQEKFRFENEYRISLMYTKGDKDIEELSEFEEMIVLSPDEGIKLEVDLNVLIQEIYISPFASKNFVTQIKNLSHKYLTKQPLPSQINL